MNPVTEDMKDVLVSDVVGTFATDLFIGKMPDGPDAAVVLHDTGGFGSPDHQNDIDSTTMQAIIRGASGGYNTAFAEARSVRSSVLSSRHTVVNSTRYVGCWITSDIAFISYDEGNRPMFSVNFRMQRA